MNAESITLTDAEAKFAASQWVMIWRRFRRNKAAMVGGVIVLLFYLGRFWAILSRPMHSIPRYVEQAYLPPQRVHFIDDGQFKPFVYKVESGRDPKTLKKIHVTTDEKIYLKFFVKGDNYKLLGQLSVSLFEIGYAPVRGGRRRAGQHPGHRPTRGAICSRGSCSAARSRCLSVCSA